MRVHEANHHNRTLFFITSNARTMMYSSRSKSSLRYLKHSKSEYRAVILQKCLTMLKKHMTNAIDFDILSAHCDSEPLHDIQMVYNEILTDHWMVDLNLSTRNEMKQRVNKIIKWYRRTAMETGASIIQSRSHASSVPPDVAPQTESESVPSPMDIDTDT
eukprot:507075_1